MVKKYLIIDFSASRYFTHHWSYVNSMANLLTAHNKSFVSILPSYADPSTLETLSGPRKLILRSNIFGPERNENFRLYLLNKIVDFFMNTLRGSEFKFLLLTKKVLINFYLAPAIKEIQRSLRENNSVHIVFPTVDHLALSLLLRILVENDPRVFVSAKFIHGAEKRGSLISGLEMEEVISELRKNDNPRIRIGFEVEKYRNYLILLGMPMGYLYWAPDPSKVKIHRQIKSDSENIVLGFLGGAKARKGFALIPEIITKVSNSFPNSKFIVQGTSFKWEGYDTIKSQLLAVPSDIQIYDGHISEQLLEELIGKCDALILPYDAISYSMAASAVVYQSANLLVPVLVSEGTGFAQECIEFGIGEIFSSAEEVALKLRVLLSDDKSENIRTYNIKRNEVVSEFLNLN